MKFYGVFSKGSKINQIICAVLINLPVLAYGASIGWMSPMMLLLQSEDSPRRIPLTDAEVSWMAAVPYLFCIPFNFLVAILADKVGRKLTLLLISASGCVSWILLLSSFNTWALILSRSLVGITMSGAYVTCTTYTKEISDDSIRGTLGCLITLFQTIGSLFLYVVGDLLDYDKILWICLSVPVLHMILFLFMPDSPSYLVKKGNIEGATKAIAWLRCKPITDPEITEELTLLTNQQQKDEEDNQFLLKTIFTDKILCRAFQISMIVTLSREFGGAVPLQTFAGEIFTLASKDKALILSPNQQAMMLGGVQVVGSILVSGVIDISGRKPLLLASALISGLSMCTLATWFLIRDYGILAPSWVPILTLCICIFCDSCGLSPMSYVLVGEIFSFKYRGSVMAAAMSAASLADFFELLFFKPLANSVGIHVAFYFFGIVCFLMAAYVLLVIPETRGRPLTNIYKDLIKKNDLETINM
ncbi:unnamed protein product, partial [Brenthis ino]